MITKNLKINARKKTSSKCSCKDNDQCHQKQRKKREEKKTVAKYREIPEVIRSKTTQIDLYPPTQAKQNPLNYNT